MKKYMKIKDFIPEKFYNKKKIIRNKRENGIILLLLLLNLILLPTNINNFDENKKAVSIREINMYSDKVNINEIDNISKWIENILDYDIEEVYINKNKGEIIIKGLENIDKLSENKSIVIKDVNLISDGKYKLGVSLYE